MRPVSPDLMYPEITLAEDQLHLKPLTVAVDEEGPLGRRFVSRWRFTNEDRARVAAGEDLILIISAPQHPAIIVSMYSDVIQHPDASTE